MNKRENIKSSERRTRKIFRSTISVLKFSVSIRFGILLLFSFFVFSCAQLQSPKTEPFYAEKVTPPPVQEFRWTNGRMPKSFDPARASAPPETDFVRALYEGLTDSDSATLKPVSAIAAKWTASPDFKTWTFYLRKDAKWSNGEAITARDFARSWQRLVELGDQVPQRGLLKNIVGMDTENVLPVFANEEVDVLSKDSSTSSSEQLPASNNTKTGQAKSGISKSEKNKQPKKNDLKDLFGVEAIDDFTLQVKLVQPDADFASLVAHPMFRPVYGDGAEFETGDLNPRIITSGAFRIESVMADNILLARAENYWDAAQVGLEKVRFVAADNAENALAAYRVGEVDAVTNADFKPLALKLLAPYDDFQRATHSALNFYQFNAEKPQFKDERVRKALAMSIERERLTEDELDGASHPALSFSPQTEDERKISQDVIAAQKLLADAGYTEGKFFPTIQLLINRNDVQRRIARAVAKMWKKNLNIETEIIVKDAQDFEQSFKNGEYDIVRRGVVLPTSDETANMLALFPPASETVNTTAEKKSTVTSAEQVLNEKTAESKLDFGNSENSLPANSNAVNNSAIETDKNSPTVVRKNDAPQVLTEQQAIDLLPAIPLYFPTSYWLVKPYVEGFQINSLDAPSLKNVRINNSWQPSNQKLISNQ